MKLLFDFFPILLFFIAYKFFDIYVATGVAIAATFLQVAISWFRTRKVETMQLVTLAIIIVFGGLTLYLHDEQFIKWKPTVINWLFGGGFPRQPDLWSADRHRTDAGRRPDTAQTGLATPESRLGDFFPAPWAGPTSTS